MEKRLIQIEIIEHDGLRDGNGKLFTGEVSAMFHCWGSDTIESHNGTFSEYSVGIIEVKKVLEQDFEFPNKFNGTVLTVHPARIRFVNLGEIANG